MPSSPVPCSGIWRAGGYQVACAEHFDDVLSEFAAFDPQLVLLDISLPFFNGYHWCREIRKVSKVPILFLTSASDDMNLVMAMEMGGDDLLAKPFHLQVLSAKVQAMLRRAYDFAGTAHLISCGGAVLNVSDGTLIAHGQKICFRQGMGERAVSHASPGNRYFKKRVAGAPLGGY